MLASDKWILITRYLSGECSKQERILVEKWIKSDPEIKQSFDRLQQIWKVSDRFQNYSRRYKMDIESEWKRLSFKINSLEVQSNENEKKSTWKLLVGKSSGKASPLIQLLRVAAIILVMLGGGYVLTQVLYIAPEPAVTELESDPHFREIATSTSQLAGVELTDGSKVNLSVESSLRLSNQYNRIKREVYIDGHAYFDVLSDPDRPFVVETSHAILTVLGTDFTVRSYPDDDYVQLVVVSGTVSLESRVGNGRMQENLSKGQMGLLNKMTGELTVKQVKADRFLGWMNGQIIFDETPLWQVSRDLERWFGVTIEISDAPLRNLRFTAELSSRSLSHVLSVISHALEVEYEMDEDRVWITQSPDSQ